MVASVSSQSLMSVLGKKDANALRRAFNYRTIGELLEHYPRRLMTRGELTTMDKLPPGEHLTIVAEVVEVTTRDTHKRDAKGRRGSILEVTITDGRGLMTLTFFNQPWRAAEFHPHERGMFAGKVSMFHQQMQLAHPDYVMFDAGEGASAEQAKAWAERPIPVYSATNTMASWRIAKLINTVLDAIDVAAFDAEDPLDDDAKLALGVGTRSEALQLIHRPATNAEWEQGKAAMRAREAYVLQAALCAVRQEKAQDRAVSRTTSPGGALAVFDAHLPFALTDDQLEVSDVMLRELAAEHPMYRLIQGEVGSGKTVVALRGMLAVVESGGQAALLAPTEVLARQHFQTILSLLGPDLSAKVHPILITGSMGAAERKRAALEAAVGQAGIVVGTHALLSDATMFYDLGLVVVDEQHRFGVAQREQLRSKAKTTPHMLLLTATPIPRTVAMTVFGDLDVSSIRTLPNGRQPIKTFVVALDEHPQWIRRVWQRVAEEVAAGRQAYVVCSVIDEQAVIESEDAAEPSFAEQPSAEQSSAGRSAQNTHIMSVEEVARRLHEHDLLGSARIGVLHGQLSGAEKDDVMRTFAAGEYDVLVTTTVVEVGVNVPNATIMVVMDADRFGIAQLHQLRGRIGRGEYASVALLVTGASADSLARERLDAVAATTDGFALAEADLAYRHEGDVLGAEQSGAASSLKLLRVIDDQELILRAKGVAEATFVVDPTLDNHAELRTAIARALSTEQEQYIVSA